jgi:putative solute:sodium symporter small subunit
MSGSSDGIWWRKTKVLMIICLAIWAFAGFGIHYFVNELNTITFIGFPLGFYMAAQGSLIIFVLLIFWFSARQDAIDRDNGVAEED